jgi:periplasmic copper chaperone A
MKAPTLMATLFLIGGSVALAQNDKASDIEIAHPWASSNSQLTNSAAYMSFTNHGTAPDELISASSPVAQKVQLHVFDVENGVYAMRPVNAIEVEPGAAPIVLWPGGAHVMLEGLKQPLQPGKTFPLLLTFKRAGKIRIDVQVEGRRATIAKIPG